MAEKSVEDASGLRLPEFRRTSGGQSQLSAQESAGQKVLLDEVIQSVSGINPVVVSPFTSQPTLLLDAHST